MHFRIKNAQDRFTAGEFPTYEAAAEWARQRIGGFWTIHETDRYGNELHPKKAEVIDST